MIPKDLNIDWMRVWPTDDGYWEVQDPPASSNWRPMNRYGWSIYYDNDGKETSRTLIDHGEKYGPEDPTMAAVIFAQNRR